MVAFWFFPYSGCFLRRKSHFKSFGTLLHVQGLILIHEARVIIHRHAVVGKSLFYGQNTVLYGEKHNLLPELCNAGTLPSTVHSSTKLLTATIPIMQFGHLLLIKPLSLHGIIAIILYDNKTIYLQEI